MWDYQTGSVFHHHHQLACLFYSSGILWWIPKQVLRAFQSQLRSAKCCIILSDLVKFSHKYIHLASCFFSTRCCPTIPDKLRRQWWNRMSHENWIYLHEIKLWHVHLEVNIYLKMKRLHFLFLLFKPKKLYCFLKWQYSATWSILLKLESRYWKVTILHPEIASLQILL